MSWETFRYNFRWSDYVWLLNGWTSKFSFAVPIVGYLILFNDSVAATISFDRLTNGQPSFHGLSSDTRLRLLYFGLIFLGISNICYFIFRPHVLRLAENQINYTNTALNIFTLRDYISINDRIGYGGHVTLYGKYYDRDWGDFLQRATGDYGDVSDLTSAHWSEAKAKHENLLRCMLIDHFFYYDTKRRFILLFLLFLSTLGYALIMIPSLDLFIRVVRVIFKI